MVSPGKIDERALAGRFAPVLHFHPKEGKVCGLPADANLGYQYVKEWKKHDYGDLLGCGTNRCYRTIERAKEPKRLINVPIFYQFFADKDKGVARIKYWVWYNYNESWPLYAVETGDHFGDWESVEVVLKHEDQKFSPVGFVLSNHWAGFTRYVNVDAVLNGKNASYHNGEHLNVWVELGSHAHYEHFDPIYHAGTGIYYFFVGLWHRLRDKGPVMKTEDHLVPMENATFTDYKGSWGGARNPLVNPFGNSIHCSWKKYFPDYDADCTDSETHLKE